MFSVSTLDIPESHGSIKIDRAHRFGSYSLGKTRPVAAKFSSSNDNYDIKQTDI